jgi:hypothetical protein
MVRSRIAWGASRGGEEEGGGQRVGSAAGEARVVWVPSRGGAEDGLFFQFWLGNDGEGKGGPDGYTRWVCVGWVRKTIRFWQKHSPNYDFLVLHSPSTLPTSKNI